MPMLVHRFTKRMQMNQTRRDVVRQGSIVALLMAAGLLRPGDVCAADWNPAAFEIKKLEDLVTLLGGEPATASDAIAINAPDIAENGAVVPITVSSAVPGTDAISILVEKNPNVLAAAFEIPAGTLPEINTRVKMAQTSNLFVLVRAAGKYFYAAKEIKITLGGCGG